MDERLVYSWDDDTGSHTVCSECLKAFGQIAVCQTKKDAPCELCEYAAGTDKELA
jgi:hypothetical protein